MSSMRSEHDTGRFCPGSRWGCDVDQVVLFMLSMFIGGGTAALEV